MVSINHSTLPISDINNWGRCGWQFMMAIAYVYPKHPNVEDKINIRSFLQSTARVLPCSLCRYHFERAVYSMPRNALQSSQDLLRWMNTAQNDIRKRQKRNPVTFETMQKQCTQGYPGFIGITWKQIAVVFAALLVALVAYTIHKRKA